MSRLWFLPTVAVLGFILVGVGGAFVGLIAPITGFSLFGLGMLVALLSALGLSGAAALASARGFPWRGAAVRAAVVPVVVMLAFVLPVLISGPGRHPIHDVTTDPEDTLTFTPDVAALRPAEKRAEVLAQQRALYPDLAPLEIDAEPFDAFFIASAAVGEQSGWEILNADPEGGRIEAVARSRFFKFEDDVVIRIQESGTGSRIDVRSRSRVGESDLGANAQRIRDYLAAVKAGS